MKIRVALILLVAAATATACSSKPKASPDAGAPDAGPPPLAFPPGFLWSVSTAAEQSEGQNTTNDWYLFEGMGKVPPVGWADDMLDRYDTDFANAQSLGCTAFRLTFEWGRLVPNAPADPLHMTPADFDPTALAYYHAVLTSLHAHGLTPLVTLVHYTLPTWVDDPTAYAKTSSGYTPYSRSLGAWTNPATAVAFGSYAGAVATEFGSQVTYWLTENEPELDLVDGYMVGLFPPGFSDLSLSGGALPAPDGGVAEDDGGVLPYSTPQSVLTNIIAGHAAAYHAIHAAEPGAQVSIAHNSIDFVSRSEMAADISATQRLSFLYNDLFFDAATSGQLDVGLVGSGPYVTHADWANTMDFIGVNFYFRNYVAPANLFSPVNAVPCNPLVGNELPGGLADFGCPSDSLDEPTGLDDILQHYAQRYHLPILITENGDGDGVDADKAGYLVQNLLAVHAAIDAGADVIGYSYWTLNDDYEWADGYKDSFGLFTVAGFHDGPDGGLPLGPGDGGLWYPTSSTDFTRVPYPEAVATYRAITDAGGIPASLIAEYAPDGGF